MVEWTKVAIGVGTDKHGGLLANNDDNNNNIICFIWAATKYSRNTVEQVANVSQLQICLSHHHAVL